MADVTQNTFDETKKYIKAIFQRGRNVLDSELNELQDNARVNFYRELQSLFGTTELVVKSNLSFGIGGGTNQITIGAGVGSAYGYLISQSSPVNVTGLTTPGGARTDCVWLSISETEIDSIADTTIATAALGETTRRGKLVIGWGVLENSLVPPATTGEPWAGGTVYIKVASIDRTATSGVDIAKIYYRKRLFRQSLDNVFSDLAPVASYIYDDVAHSTVDRFGFLNFGAVGNWNENWSWKSVSNTVDFAENNYTFTSNGTGSSEYSVNTDFGEFGYGLSIHNGVGEASGKFTQVIGPKILIPTTKTVFAIEWSVLYLGTDVSGFNGSTTQTFYCGLTSALTAGVPTTSSAYFLWNGPLTPNWKVEANGTGSTNVATSITGGTTPRHFRIEIIGSAADSFANPRINFYIDNVFISESSCVLIGGSTLSFFCSAVSTGTTATDAILISDVRAAWRRFITPSKR